jgi:asparagine synthase (glutamine-hydrolysing)
MPAGALAPLVPPLCVATRGRSRSAQRIKERAYGWTADSLADLYDVMTSCWQSADHLVVGAGAQGRNGNIGRSARRAEAADADPVAQMMYTDVGRYLPDDILVKVDRAAMAVSLETRVPLLDVEVARAAWRIPTAVHMRDGRGKWVLRRLLERDLPRALFERPKSGFALPVARWLRGELREWAAAQLDPARLRREGYLFGPEIERRWRQHASGQADWSGHLWTVLMFQAWLEDFGCRGAAVQAAAPAGSSSSRRMESVNLSAMP